MPNMTRWERFLCNWLGWHKPNYHVNFAGLEYSPWCARCGRRILQDGRGNWFEVKDERID